MRVGVRAASVEATTNTQRRREAFDKPARKDAPSQEEKRDNPHELSSANGPPLATAREAAATGPAHTASTPVGSYPLTAGDTRTFLRARDSVASKDGE